MKTFSFVILCAAAHAQLTRPSVGFMIDGNAQLREVTGIAASATAGDALLSKVHGLACGTLLCIGKLDDAVLDSAGHIVSAPPGPALFAVAGMNAFVYFNHTHELKRWNEGALTPIDFSPEGEVLSIRVNGNGFDYAIRRGEDTLLEHYSLDNASIFVVAVLGKTGAVILHDAGALLETSDHLLLIRPDGSGKEFPLSGITSYWHMSANAIGVAAAHGRWVIEMTPFSETVNLLPGVEPQ